MEISKKQSPGLPFWLALLIVAVAAFLAASTYLGWQWLVYPKGRAFLPHWLGVTGATFIALYVPVFHFLKRSKPNKTSYSRLLGIHVFGNLLAFTLISFHWATQTKPPIFPCWSAPDWHCT